MARNTLKLLPASEADISELGYWFGLAGVPLEDDGADTITDLLDAHAAGHLGTAFGHGLRGNLAHMLALDADAWYRARTAVRALKLNGQTVGMALFGAHHQLWELFDHRLSGGRNVSADGDVSPQMGRFLTSALTVSKLHLLAIHPDHQQSGHGTRVLTTLANQARSDRCIWLYGQYKSERSYLQNFYQSCGFDIGLPGEPIPFGMATGDPRDLLGIAPDETAFTMRVGAGGSH